MRGPGSESAEPAKEDAEGGGAREEQRDARRVVRKVKMGGPKPCDVCARDVDLLVRCQADASNQQWRMVCGRCWNTDAVAGGVVDGSGANPHYHYGGLWKNLKKGAAGSAAAGPGDDGGGVAALLGDLSVEQQQQQERATARVDPTALESVGVH